MENIKTCKTCLHYKIPWPQEDNTYLNCKTLGYKKVCADWEWDSLTKKAPQTDEPSIIHIEEPNFDTLFTDVLLDGFKRQAALDRTTRQFKQQLADHGFDVDIDERDFSKIAENLIGISQIRSLVMGLGIAKYEDDIMKHVIERLFKKADKS